MTWIYLGIVAGSLVTASFDSQEKCEGRRVMLERAKVAGKCVEAPGTWGTSGTISIPDGEIGPSFGKSYFYQK